MKCLRLLNDNVLENSWKKSRKLKDEQLSTALAIVGKILVGFYEGSPKIRVLNVPFHFRLCGQSFGLLGPSKFICDDCRKPVCSKCSIELNSNFPQKK